MPDEIAPLPKLPDWAAPLINLASPRLGAEATEASDDFFADRARLLQDAPAVWKPDVFDDNGKWMDGWESRRRRDSGHDWCVIRLGVTGAIRGVDIDTSWFTGNYPKAASLQGARGEGRPGEADWVEVVPSTTLGPSGHHFIEASAEGPFNWLRLNIHPDGGVARLRVYGTPVPDWSGAGDETVELSAIRNGGRVLAFNDAHYGDVWAVLSEGRGRNQADGWETRRRREPGNDWLIAALGARGTVERLEIDTAHFKGNFPHRVSLQAADVTWGTDGSVATQAMFWPVLMEPRPVGPDAIHVFEGEALAALGPVSHVKLNLHPDGGVSRLRVFGRRA